MKNKAKQSSVLIIALCWLAYTVAYMGRLNFNAYIEPIKNQLGASKTELGLVGSFFFFSYGAGQLFHGILSKKYNTRYSVAVALIGSAAVNLAMSFCTDAGGMKYLWLFNGFFQSILWSSVIKTLGDRLPDEMFPKAIVVMSTPAALGTFLAYGMSAALSSAHASYKTVFYIPAVLLSLTGAVWFILVAKADKLSKESNELPYVKDEKKKADVSPAFVFGAVLLLITAISNGFIKDGVTTWTPSILKERYGMEESFSILITVILPLIAVTGSWFSTRLHKRWKNTSALNAGLYLAETVVLFFVMISARNASIKSPVLLIILFSGSAMLMSAVNNIITAIIPLYMRDRIESGLLAGVLDTFCYVGSSLSTGLLGYIADKRSWNGVFLCLFIFGGAASILCVLSVINERVRKRMKQYKFSIPSSDISKTFDEVCITAVSANVRCYTGGDEGKRNWYYRGSLMVQTLIDANADIIGLQESMKVHYDCIGGALNGYGSFIDYRDDDDNPEGCPIFYNLSKFELLDKGTFWLSETPDKISKGWGAACYRICSFAILRQISDGKELAVFNTHLDHVSEEARINGIKLILRKLTEFGGMPCVIMGDLNDFEHSVTYKEATALFDDAKYKTDDTDSGATYHAWGELPDYENIDYFLISKSGIEVFQYRVVRTTYNGVYPSDHYPIMLKFNLK